MTGTLVTISDPDLRNEDHAETLALAQRLQEVANIPHTVLVTSGEQNVAVDSGVETITIGTGMYLIMYVTAEEYLPDSAHDVGLPETFPIFTVQDLSRVDDGGGIFSARGMLVFVGAGYPTLTEAYVRCVNYRRRITNAHKPQTTT